MRTFYKGEELGLTVASDIKYYDDPQDYHDLPDADKESSNNLFILNEDGLTLTADNIQYEEDSEDSVKDKIDSLNDTIDEITKSDFGTQISILNYTSSNKYTCPSDGYIRTYSSSSSGGYASVRLESKNGSNYTTMTHTPNGKSNTFNSMYVRKGTIAYVENNSVSGTFTCAFIPFA